MTKICDQILQGSAVTQTVLDGLITNLFNKNISVVYL